MSRHWIDYLKSQGAQLSDEGDHIHFPPGNESTAQVCVLSSQAIIEARGPDTVKFLQGQLTCNMETLGSMQQYQGAVCTPKGRMYSSFTLANTDANYLFRMHRGVTDSFISGLGKYAVFYKTELSLPAEPYICLGLTGKSSQSALQTLWGQVPNNNTVIETDNALLLKTPRVSNSYEIWVRESALPTVWEKLVHQFSPASEAIWRQQHIMAVIPEVSPGTVEKYIPQHLNLPSLGYVSFRKGCYTGQEIVARMQNLGQQKSRTYHITIEGADEVAAGLRITNEEGKAIGDILEATIAPNNKHEALAVLRVDTNNAFLENNPEYPITVHPIPYTIDARAELQF